MLISDYDKSLYSKIKELYDSTYYTVIPNNLKEIRNLLKSEGGNTLALAYPYICISRVGVPEIDRSQNLSRVNNGPSFIRDKSRVDMSSFNLTYQIDVCSKTKESLDTLLVELQLELLTNPNLEVESSTNVGVITPTLIIENVVDNSDIESFDDTNRVYRGTLDILTTVTVTRVEDISTIETVLVDWSYIDSSNPEKEVEI